MSIAIKIPEMSAYSGYEANLLRSGKDWGSFPACRAEKTDYFDMTRIENEKNEAEYHRNDYFTLQNLVQRDIVFLNTAVLKRLRNV